MQEVIEKLLILQDRDKKILRSRTELSTVGPQRDALSQKLSATQTGLEKAQHRLKEIEAKSKELELEIESKKEQIAKYSTQQMQTKKNEEYQALGREIDNTKEKITGIEDQLIEFMEEVDSGKRNVEIARKEANELKGEVEREIAELNERETFLTSTLKELEEGRSELASPIDPTALAQYERILNHRGEKAVVSIEHGVCEGCHMKLPTQEMVACKHQEGIVNCPFCGRILYYTAGMVV